MYTLLSNLNITALEAVNKINDELFEKYNSMNQNDNFKGWLSIMPQLSITFSNEYTFISLSIPSECELDLPEIHLYSSINDDRFYNEETDSYEQFYDFIKRKFELVKTELNKISL